MVVGIGEPPCSRIGSGAGEGIQGGTTAGRWSISNTYPSDSRSARAPAVARGTDTTSWTRPTRPVPGHRRGEAAAARVVAGTTRDRSRSRSHRRDRRSRSPRRDQRQAFSPPGFPSVLIDLRPERPGPVFLEPDPEPEVREDLRDRQDFSDKLQAVLTLAPFVGFLLPWDWIPQRTASNWTWKIVHWGCLEDWLGSADIYFGLVRDCAWAQALFCSFPLGGFTLPTTTSWTLTSGVLFAFLFERWTVCVHPELFQGSTILLLQLLWRDLCCPVLEAMSASAEKQGGMEHVPAWDGQAKGWRR